MRIVALEEHFAICALMGRIDPRARRPATPVRIVIDIGVGDAVEPGIANASSRAARPHAAECAERREERVDCRPRSSSVRLLPVRFRRGGALNRSWL